MASRVSWRPTSWRRGLAIGSLVLFFALLDGLHTQAGFVAEGAPHAWSNTLGLTAVFWLVYAAFLPPVLFVADRYPIDIRRPRTLLIHLSGALAFTYVHILVIGFLTAPFRQAPDAWVPLLGRLVRLNFSIDFLAYWAIVGAMFALRYYNESRQREVAAAQLQVSLAAARLDALRAKLNPHFLFNTLNAISVLALKRQHIAVVDAISHLSSLLRVSLDDTRPQQIPLSEELRFLDGYLEIIRLRFGDRMVVERHVTAESLDAVVPNMILQPVVENAVVHGVAARCGEGHIAIEARRVNDSLHLRVTDNGPGFSSGATPGVGIGLSNTRARLAQIYGGAHSLELSNATDGGAIVTMTLPFVAFREFAVPA